MWGVFVKGNPEPLWLCKNPDVATIMAHVTKITARGHETAEAWEIDTSLGPITVCKHCNDPIVQDEYRPGKWVHLGPMWRIFCPDAPMYDAEPY